jgi:PKD domain-containing protein
MPRHGHDSPLPTCRSRAPRRLRAAALGALACFVLLLCGAPAAPAQGTAASPDAATGPTQPAQSPTPTPTPTTDTTTDASQSTAPPVVDGPLVVTMTASPQVATVGETVTYTADVSGVPPGKQVRYDWAFSGGTATGQQVSRSYPNPGDYPVAVTVTVVSVAGLSGVADQLTVVVSNTPAKVHGSASGSPGGQGSGSGTGSGHGSGNGSAEARAARAAKRAKQAAAAAGVANPLATQAPSPAGVQVEGFLLTDAGVPFAPAVPQAPTPGAGGSGGAAAAVGGAASAAGVGGALALTIAIVTLGALDERRRLSLRYA